MQKVYTKDVPKKSGTKVKLGGWAREIRDLGNLKFLILADREGEIQITAKRGKVSEEIMKAISSMSRESSLYVTGKVKLNKQAPGGREVIPTKIEVLSKAHTPLPLEVTGKTPADFDTRINHRYLDIRKPEVYAIFKIKSEICTGAREWFEKNDFLEVHLPKIIGSVSEGGAEVFPIIYFEREAFLIQSPQLHKQAAMMGFERVYEIGPVWRAEKSRTTRHVTEFMGIDAEIGFAELEDILKVQEKLIQHIYRYIAKNCKPELKVLNKKVKIPKIPFKRLSYDDALKLAKKLGHKMEWGDDFPTQTERDICKRQKNPFFIIGFPTTAAAFYYALDEKNPKATKKVDLMSSGEAGVELSSGGLRINDYNTLMRRVKECKINPESLKWYLEMFKYGVPPHGGFGLGVERILRSLLDIERVQELVLFPRTPDRLEP